MNYTKIFGWVLLSVGLLVISWTLYSSYNIFFAKTTAPEIFKVPEQALVQKGKTDPLDAQIQMEKALQEQLKNLLPQDTLPKILNLAAWSMLATIFMFGGGQISSLGIKMLKS